MANVETGLQTQRQIVPHAPAGAVSRNRTGLPAAQTCALHARELLRMVEKLQHAVAVDRAVARFVV